jgi:hypothetical protein
MFNNLEKKSLAYTQPEVSLPRSQHPAADLDTSGSISDHFLVIFIISTYVSRDSSVGITTRYGLDRPDSIPVGARFFAPV